MNKKTFVIICLLRVSLMLLYTITLCVVFFQIKQKSSSLKTTIADKINIHKKFKIYKTNKILINFFLKRNRMSMYKKV